MWESFMRLWSTLVCSAMLLVSRTGFTAEIAGTGVNFPAQYAGGSLLLDQGRIKATIAQNELVFLHGSQKLAIPLQSITAVTYGSDHHRSVLCFVPFLDLDKEHYVGLTWTGTVRDGEQASNEAVLKFREGKYRHFVEALERLTGIKAVNADKLPALVRYGL